MGPIIVVLSLLIVVPLAISYILSLFITISIWTLLLYIYWVLWALILLKYIFNVILRHFQNHYWKYLSLIIILIWIFYTINKDLINWKINSISLLAKPPVIENNIKTVTSSSWTTLENTWITVFSAEMPKDIVIHQYYKPKDLFYWLHIKEKPVVTQDPNTHFKNNWRLAVDVWVYGKSVAVYVPDYKWKEITYTIKRIKSFDYWNWVQLDFTVDWVSYYWIYWHTTMLGNIKDWTSVKTWDVIWFLDLSWITTWYHLHCEFWQWTNQVIYSEKGEQLIKSRERNTK